MLYPPPALAIATDPRYEPALHQPREQKRVVVALEGRGSAENAIAHAVRLARHWEAPLQLVQARNPVDQALPLSLRLIARGESAAPERGPAEHLESLARSLERQHDISVTWDASVGGRARRTLRSLCQTGARALVVARSQSGTFPFWQRSVLDDLIGRLPVPLIIVPESAARPAGATHDFETGYSRLLIHLEEMHDPGAVFEGAMSVASAGAVCHLLRVVPFAARWGGVRDPSRAKADRRLRIWPESLITEEERQSQRVFARTRLVVEGRRIGSAIVEQAQAMRSQLIVLAAKPHLLPWWLRSGASEHVVRNATVPVMIVPGQRQSASQPVLQP